MEHACNDVTVARLQYGWGEAERQSRADYALEALRLFGAAGRCVPAERLVPYGDEEGPTEAVRAAACMQVHRLRQRGYRIETLPFGYGAYRLAAGDA